MVINLNTVWATIAGVAVFGGTLLPGHYVGVSMSIAGNYLCTVGAPSQKQSVAATDGGAKTPGIEPKDPTPLLKWLAPGLIASGVITSVEMTARYLAIRHEATPALFAQAQVLVLLLRSNRRRRSCCPCNHCCLKLDLAGRFLPRDVDGNVWIGRSGQVGAEVGTNEKINQQRGMA